MELLSLYTILFVYSCAFAGKTCTNPERLISFENGAMLPEAKMATLNTEGLMDCAKQCLLRKKCKSFNFYKESGECQLNERTVDNSTAIWEQLERVDGSIFCESSALPDRLAGVCANHGCPLNSMCVAMNGTYDCRDLGCQGSPSIENGLLQNGTTNGESEVGTVYRYGCNEGYVGAGQVTCLTGGAWSSGMCDLITTCRMVQECLPGSTDGEFWLPVTKFNNYKALIYCHGMNTETPMEYISLPNTNYGNYPKLTNLGCRGDVHYLTNACVGQGGESWYTKIRVHVETMEVDISNKAFANFTNYELRYGSAKDCYTHHHNNVLSACGTKGRFTIDLRLTGWKVKDGQEWYVNGYKAILEYVIVERDGTVVKIACGGRSGACGPKDGLFLEPYSTDVPVGSATELTCI